MSDLAALNKAPLLARALEMEARLAQLEAAATKPAPKRKDETGGLVPMVLHISGSEALSTLCELRRVGPKGPQADIWLLIRRDRRGPRMILRTGQDVEPVHWAVMPEGLRKSSAWTVKDALAYLKTAR